MKLPVDDVLPAILATLKNHDSLVLEAPPGAGKTTRVPPALLSALPKEVWVLEPRRLAARLAAQRVAQEMGEKLGQTVGYQVRFEDVSGPQTRLRFLTEGVFTRRVLSEARLTNVSAVILDEFHERHLDTDLALAVLRRLQTSARPDLKLLVMSATLHSEPIAKFLGDCPVIRSEGRLFDLKIEYTPHSGVPLEQQVLSAAERLFNEPRRGDVLVFLPGATEIRRCARALEPLSRQRNLLVLPLHGDLSPVEQDRAVTPADRAKIILSTNVAESSVTIEGVTAVVDSGLARVAVDSPWTGVPSVNVQRVSQASCTQRAGRAGRTAPGRVIRLYTEEDFRRRPLADPPEISRRELSQILLQLRAMKIADVVWLDAPPDAAWKSASQLLDRLEITPEMAGLPVPPRLAKLLVEAEERGVPERGCAIAAVLSTGERGSDLLHLSESSWQPQTRRVYDQLRRRVKGANRAGDSAIQQAILAAFPDRVAKHRKDGEILLSSGGSANFPGCHWDFLVAVDVEDRREHGRPLVRLAAPIEPEWLLDHCVERHSFDWNRSASRVEETVALLYDELVIEETRRPATPGPEASRVLAEQARQVDIGRFVDKDALAQLEARAAFAGTPIDFLAALAKECEGRISFAELEGANLLGLIKPAHLSKSAPERLRLPGGREVTVHYEFGKPPWIESRLQDFFGVRETPRIGPTPVVVHLLAPNRRPVQVTSDLAGFWERLYPQVRRELMRRYPKHKWPEKPE